MRRNASMSRVSGELSSFSWATAMGGVVAAGSVGELRDIRVDVCKALGAGGDLERGDEATRPRDFPNLQFSL